MKTEMLKMALTSPECSPLSGSDPTDPHQTHTSGVCALVSLYVCLYECVFVCLRALECVCLRVCVRIYWLVVACVCFLACLRVGVCLPARAFKRFHCISSSSSFIEGERVLLNPPDAPRLRRGPTRWSEP